MDGFNVPISIQPLSNVGNGNCWPIPSCDLRDSKLNLPEEMVVRDGGGVSFSSIRNSEWKAYKWQIFSTYICRVAFVHGLTQIKFVVEGRSTQKTSAIRLCGVPTCNLFTTHSTMYAQRHICMLMTTMWRFTNVQLTRVLKSHFVEWIQKSLWIKRSQQSARELKAIS